MKRSFFEAIGLADMERVHSQMLSWIFSSDCEGIEEHEKERILSSLCGHDIGEIDSIYTEYQSIDLLILTPTSVMVFENKLKSSQHSNQLSRYAKIVEEEFPDLIPTYLFLTLVPEIPEDKRWRNLTFEQLLGEFKEIEFETNIDGIICREYFKTIEHFCNVTKQFLNDHTHFKCVFTDVKMPKATCQQKAIEFKYDDEQRFVIDNRLGVLLQKALLHQLLLDLQEILNCNGRIDEYNGTALIHLILDTIELNGIVFETALQVQGQTMKFIFQASDYGSSKREWITEKMIQFFYEHSELHGFKCVNPGRTKALISMSKKSKQPLYEMAYDDIKVLYQTEYLQLRELSNHLMKQLKKEGI